MLELLWTLMNTILFIIFIIICFKAALVIRKELGFWSFLFLAVCIFSLAASKGNCDDTGSLHIGDRLPEINKYPAGAKHVYKELIISDDLLTDIVLQVRFYKDKQETGLISAKTIRTGIINGTNWNSVMITITDAAGYGKYTYTIIGTMEYKILGLKVYSQPREFQGSIDLNK